MGFFQERNMLLPICLTLRSVTVFGILMIGGNGGAFLPQLIKKINKITNKKGDFFIKDYNMNFCKS
jgi:hypothetical protein